MNGLQTRPHILSRAGNFHRLSPRPQDRACYSSISLGSFLFLKNLTFRHGSQVFLWKVATAI